MSTSTPTDASWVRDPRGRARPGTALAVAVLGQLVVFVALTTASSLVAPLWATVALMAVWAGRRLSLL